jgi:hypothetical protein
MLFLYLYRTKGLKMNIYPKLNEPFTFSLVKQFLPAETDQEDDVRPISDREFYGIMGMIVAALAVLEIIFHGLHL